MVTTDPQAVAWHVELRSSGRVGIDVRRGRAAFYALFAWLLNAMWVFLLVVGGTPQRVVALLLLLVMVPVGIQSVRQALRVGRWASPVVVVDADGVALRHAGLRVPWPDVYGAVAYTLQRNRMVSLVVSDEFYDAWISSRGPVLRLLGRRWRSSAGQLNLPANLDVDTEAFAGWLTHEAQVRLAAQA